MEFGKVPPSELNDIDFTLPDDPISNNEVLNGSRGPTEFRVGMAKWGRKDWVGRVYPSGTKDKDFLHHYSQYYNSIEFNAVGYSLPSKEQVQIWTEKASEDFLFCPKFTNVITHIKRLRRTEEDVARYLDVMRGMGKKLGPIFLVPSPQIGVKDISVLENFMTELPSDLDMFLELRNQEWYEPDGYNEEIRRVLRRFERGTVITDTAGRRDCVHMQLTKKEVFIRFGSNDLHPTDFKRIDSWVSRINEWKNGGLKKCYFFIHTQQDIHAPVILKYLIEQLNEHCQASLKVPPFDYASLPKPEL